MSKARKTKKLAQIFARFLARRKNCRRNFALGNFWHNICWIPRTVTARNNKPRGPKDKTKTTATKKTLVLWSGQARIVFKSSRLLFQSRLVFQATVSVAPPPQSLAVKKKLFSVQILGGEKLLNFVEKCR